MKLLIAKVIDMGLQMDKLRKETLAFVETNRVLGGEMGEYRYSSVVTLPTLYSSTYAVMTRSLYNDLDVLTSAERQAWIDYFNRYQDDDGLFRDPVIFNQYSYKGDYFGNGRPHLTCHILTALTCLKGVAKKSFALVKKFSSRKNLESWLESRDWGKRVASTGNEIMNLGTILQYARDFQNDARAGSAVEFLLNWLDTHYIHSDTGVWGDIDIVEPQQRSHAVQAAYHWWALYFYDHHPIPYVERAIDTLLATQNQEGGFGWGVHNSSEPYKSSACEDIDSIDPLARMSFYTDYRREDIKQSLEKALGWVKQNQMPDGGFVFMLDKAYQYGHPELNGEKNAGAMFPTWFRTLCLAYLGKTITNNPIWSFPWHFCNCPGYQFWEHE
ncbi:MAG: hypothetical protein Q7J67_07825 [bacterium]|nr:hypothetical protein [bacterium]